MGFASGSVSFRRLTVVGAGPTTVDQSLLDKLDENALRPGEMGIPEDVEYGWSGGRHVLDGAFAFENNVFADTLMFGLRVDTNKVPGEIKKAYVAMEEEAVAKTNPSGFISKNQKREVKETVQRRIDDEMREGRYRRSRLVPILWDVPAGTVYCPATGKNLEKLLEIFERTFGLALLPITSGSLALRLLEPSGKRRDYEDLRPTRFVLGPEGESQYPEYPWVAKGPEPKDFVGNEFMLWLWHEADRHNGVVKAGGKAVAILIDKSLSLECGYGMTGKDTLAGTGPAQMPEARDALRSGKLPRKAGLILDSDGQQFTLSFNPEAIGFGSAKLPEVEEAETPRVLFEERITLLRDLCKTVDGLFEAFLKLRTSSAWESQMLSIRKWIIQPARTQPVAALA